MCEDRRVLDSRESDPDLLLGVIQSYQKSDGGEDLLDGMKGVCVEDLADVARDGVEIDSRSLVFHL